MINLVYVINQLNLFCLLKPIRTQREIKQSEYLFLLLYTLINLLYYLGKITVHILFTLKF